MIDIVGLVHTFGYLGVFLASLIGSATIILPVPSFALVIAAGSELTGYGLGYGIYHVKNIFGEASLLRDSKKLRFLRKFNQRKTKKEKKELGGWKKTFNHWFHNRRLGFALIVIFSFTPLPDDILGLFCGATKYDVKKFFLATLIGKIMLGLVLAYAGLLGLEFLERYF
ncbi:MAG: VTT domain-containing protein [Candidatus Aenigmarchaeota archaeon]|nr:VTT domain-containing protein [Candidatus Aenigmarchaeota archaeon]